MKPCPPIAGPEFTFAPINPHSAIGLVERLVKAARATDPRPITPSLFMLSAHSITAFEIPGVRSEMTNPLHSIVMRSLVTRRTKMMAVFVAEAHRQNPLKEAEGHHRFITLLAPARLGEWPVPICGAMTQLECDSCGNLSRELNRFTTWNGSMQIGDGENGESPMAKIFKPIDESDLEEIAGVTSNLPGLSGDDLKKPVVGWMGLIDSLLDSVSPARQSPRPV